MKTAEEAEEAIYLDPRLRLRSDFSLITAAYWCRAKVLPSLCALCGFHFCRPAFAVSCRR
jgi:hypothetical protein